MATLKKINNKLVVSDVTLTATDSLSLDYGESLEVNVSTVDKRIITEKQRKFIFALCNDMAYYTGDDSEWCRMQLQQAYANLLEIEVKSLSSCSMTYANGLIKSIIDYFIYHEIPFNKELIKSNEYTFTEKQVYMMILKRMCVVTGRRAEIHHVDTIGMGNNRNKVSHIGKRLLPLCREMHQEIHTIGDNKFIEKYHLNTIVCDEKIEYFIKKGHLRMFKEDL